MSLFEQQWQTYRTVLEHDAMEHRAAAAATGEELQTWLAQRPAHRPPPTLVDLGCGDLARMADLFSSTCSSFSIIRRINKISSMQHPQHWS